jgi:hypothetical protein
MKRRSARSQKSFANNQAVQVPNLFTNDDDVADDEVEDYFTYDKFGNVTSKGLAFDTEYSFQQKLAYLYENPVIKGFVEKPDYWPYSSARNYLLDDHSIIEVECLK